MDIGKYSAAKKCGHCDLKKYGEQFQLIKRQFDPDTGAEIAPIVTALDKRQILAEREKMVVALAGLDALIADMDALEKA